MTKCLGTRRTVGFLSVLVIVGGLAGFASYPVAAAVDPGVQNVTAVARVSDSDSIVFVTWSPATAAQQQGLSWTSVYFGEEPMPILVFGATLNDVTIPQVLPGTYRVAVEFDYGDRSHYTHTPRGQTTVTVGRRRLPSAAPLAPAAVTTAANGQSVTVTWRHDPAETADQHPVDYVVSLGDTRVAVVPGYDTLTRTITQVTAGVHRVTVTARNGAGYSPASSGAPVTVASPRTLAARAGTRSLVHWPGTVFEWLVALLALAILAAAAFLATSLFFTRAARAVEPRSKADAGPGDVSRPA
jgi:hypothetical protein